MNMNEAYQQCRTVRQHQLWRGLMIILIMLGMAAVVLFWSAWEPMTDNNDQIVLAPTPDENLIVSIDEPGVVIFSMSFDGELTFYRDGAVIGRLWHDDQDVFHFDGDADASAHIFFEYWSHNIQNKGETHDTIQPNNGKIK